MVVYATNICCLFQVPCYVFDDVQKRDLNPLIKVSGAYSVDDSDDDLELLINVCRNIGLNVCEHCVKYAVVQLISSSFSPHSNCYF